MSPAAYWISLTIIAFLAGVAILPVFSRFSNKEKLRLAKRRIRAALYEFRLFGDEPRLVFRAQGQLLLWNVRYLGHILRPAAIVIVPMLLLLSQLDLIYGHRALHPGESAIVTAQVAKNVDLSTTTPRLTAQGLAIDTPAVRLAGEHSVLWRIRAETPGADRVSVALQGNEPAVDKTVHVGGGLHYLADLRGASLLDWFGNPIRARVPAASPIRSVRVEYPDADTTLFGFSMLWIVWFVIISWGAMFALRKRFGVII